MSVFRRVTAVLVALALLGTGCQRSSGDRTDEPVQPRWRPLTLPASPGEPGRTMLRDVTACGGRWYLVGGVATAQGETRPAAWTSTDGLTWTVVPISAESYYGVRNVLYAAACRDGRVAAIGAKAGGAHGNPRVRTWSQLPDGSMTEVDADFEVFGGPKAVSVARVAGGPLGWLIAGTRVSGAAVWTSPDAVGFHVVEGAPELASDARGRTWATDVVADSSGWTLVGGLGAVERGGADPMVWASSDGRNWRRVAVPADREYDELHRVAATTAGMVAIGIRGGAFGAWVEANGSWQAAGRFGVSGGAAAPGVDGVAVADDLTLVAAHAADGHTLWVSDSAAVRWAPVELPTSVPTNGDTAMTVAANEGRAVLVIDDGRSGRAWTGVLPRSG